MMNQYDNLGAFALSKTDLTTCPKTEHPQGAGEPPPGGYLWEWIAAGITLLLAALGSIVIYLMSR